MFRLSTYLTDDRPAFIKLAGERESYVRWEDIHKLGKSQRDAVSGKAFSSINAQSASTDSMLERLEQLSPSTASMFCNRARRIGDFVFRLISRPNESLAVERPSYVALSHRWSNPQLATAESLVFT